MILREVVIKLEFDEAIENMYRRKRCIIKELHIEFIVSFEHDGRLPYTVSTCYRF